jgi:feruloyl-CoA synthase
VERRPGGEWVLTNPTPFSTVWGTAMEPLDHWAERAPDRTWLAERAGAGWRTISYREAREQVAALAGGLRGLGVVGRRPLLILARNGVDHALMSYAAMNQGMPIAPVSPQYGLPGAILARLAHAVEVLRPGRRLHRGRRAVRDGAGGAVPGRVAGDRGPERAGGDMPFDRLLAGPSAEAVARPEDAAKYLLTSGSTGHPKAVTITQQGLAFNAAQVTACFDDPEPPVIVNAAPWSHSLGANAILHMGLHRGGTLYIDAGQPVAGRFEETLRNLREVSPTYHNMVPAGWMLLAGELERDEALARRFFARVRVLQYGGAALGQSVGDRIQAVAVRTVGERISFASGYGATETGPTACNVHWPNARMGLIGLPIPGTSVRLVPEAGKLEFRVKGPQVTAGYLGRPELSAQAFDEEGFYRLGDAARFVDPADPKQGMVYDGRLSENFKLASGTFVGVGELRIAAVSAVGDAVTDAVVCGEGRDGVGLLFYPNPGLPREVVEQAVRDGLARHNARASGGGRVTRALVLDSPPDAAAGEITDKGYIAQALARARRADAVERLFAEPAGEGVLSF